MALVSGFEGRNLELTAPLSGAVLTVFVLSVLLELEAVAVGLALAADGVLDDFLAVDVELDGEAGDFAIADFWAAGLATDFEATPFFEGAGVV